MSTPREISIQKKNFEARRSSRITHHQSGYLDALKPGGHLQLASTDPGDGFVPGLSGQDPNDWRASVVGACNYLQIAISQLTENQPGTKRALASLLATADALVQAGDDTVEKAGINQGATRGPVVSKSNEASKTGGKAVIDISQWSDSQTWMRLAKKHPKVFEAGNQ